MRKAVLYMRMSTDHQDYSISHQRQALMEYAQSNELEVIGTYVDFGKSGLDLAGRPELRRLIQDVQAGGAQFEFVLTYDISRWGRFQNVDEAAYYEFICLRAGIRICYCAEPFANDGSPISAVMKGIKRMMAAEYSRELSSKVFQAQCRLTAMGFKQGGRAGLGLRRASVTKDGAIRRILEYGERKAAATDRVIYVHGPAEEVALVRKVFRWYVHDKLQQKQIAERLNDSGVLMENGAPWNIQAVSSVLQNEKYLGHLIFNRSSGKLKNRPTKNDPAIWVRLNSAFAPIVPKKLFAQAQEERRFRNQEWTDDALLERLRALYRDHGKLTYQIVHDFDERPARTTYRKRFGSLVNAYALAGVPDSKYTIAAATKLRMTGLRDTLVADAFELAVRAGASVVNQGRGRLTINGNIRVMVVVCRRRYPKDVLVRWKIFLRYSPPVDFLLVARLDAKNSEVEAFYLLPPAAFDKVHIWIRADKEDRCLQFRFPTLASMFGST